MTDLAFTRYGGFDCTCEEIQEWQAATFPGVSPVAAFDRLQDELDELVAEIHSLPNTTTEAVMDELADCFIVMNQIALSLSGDFGAAVHRKMTKNLNRQWTINEDGTGQHVTD